MQLYHIIPGLQPFIKTICTMDCDEDIDTRHICVLPDTCVELFVNYTSSPVAIIGNELYKRSIITFRMSRPMNVQMRKGSGCLAICFHPGMAYQFFHLPMHVFSDTTTAFIEVWKDRATEMEDRIAAADNNASRVAIAQQYLLQQLTRGKDYRQIAYCLQQVRSSNGLLPVSQLSQDTGLTQRHLSRKFQEYVGLSPKEYSRVTRFLYSLQLLKDCPTRSLTEIAYESGFYDQAHFIRDYKSYTGHTPGEVVQAQHILY